MRRGIIQGFSIIEFMISITIGTLLVATVGSVYLSNKSTYLVQEGLARLQENGRYANYFLAHEIRMAGYQGCTNQKQITVTSLVQNVSTMLDYDSPLNGFDGLGSAFSPAIPSNISGRSPVATSDVLEIRMASTASSQLNNDMALASSPVSVYGLAGVQSGVPLMITNCSVANIFIASAGSSSTLITHTLGQNTSANLSIPFLRGAQVMRFLYYAYYIKDTGRVNSQNQPILALVRLDSNGTEDEIAEGVEQMRITYGVDTDADNTADTYQTAAQVNSANNWNNVISVQINLLMATIDGVNDRAQAYTFNGVTTTPADRKLRRQWDTFVTLRNRGLPS
jgi:type IV pilus assembly protein PilW